MKCRKKPSELHTQITSGEEIVENLAYVSIQLTTNASITSCGNEDTVKDDPKHKLDSDGHSDKAINGSLESVLNDTYETTKVDEGSGSHHH